MNQKAKIKARAEGARLKLACWIRGKLSMPEEVTWRKMLEATEKKWEKLYEMACQGREQWRKMAEEQREARKKLAEEVTQLEAAMSQERRTRQVAEHSIERERALVQERLSRIYYCRPAIMEEEPSQERKNLERLMVLAGLDQTNPLWQAVLSYADEHERTERESALKPDLADGQRQYNSGRAASAYDFATALRDLYVKAQMQAERIKSKG